MRAAAVDLGRVREWDDSGSAGLLSAPPVEPGPKRAPSFKEAGLSFIPLRQAHLDLLQVVYGRNVPAMDECVGKAMVDYYYLPVGVVLVHFEPSGTNVLHAHFG